MRGLRYPPRVSGAPYRDDPSAIVAFEQHLGVAVALLEQFTEMPERMSASEEALQELQQEAQSVWEGMWENLTQARAIAVGRGRSVRDYDRAREAAGNIWLAACQVSVAPPWDAIGPVERRTVTWINAPIAPVIAAIESLTQVVPEATLRLADPVDIDVSPRFGAFQLLWLLVPLIFVGLVYLVFDSYGWGAAVALVVILVLGGVGGTQRGR